MCVDIAVLDFSTENAQFKGKRVIVTPLRFALCYADLENEDWEHWAGLGVGFSIFSRTSGYIGNDDVAFAAPVCVVDCLF